METDINKVKIIKNVDDFYKMVDKKSDTFYAVREIKEYPSPRRVTIIFEEYMCDGYHKVEELTSNDFDFIIEEVKGSNDLKIDFMIHKGDVKNA